LVNIIKEMSADLGATSPASGSLEPWASQGVLLLNTVLTVRAHEAHSHKGHGWETFTDSVIRAMNARAETVVFVLWGGAAHKKRTLIENPAHAVIEGAHPSPLSVRLFRGSRPFSKVNEALEAAGRGTIDWRL
jgi:uracil-DNA glycosylase